MNDFAEKRAVAARWMYERPNRDEIYWRWGVLTAEGNPQDDTNPKLPLSTADVVFSSLVQEGLLVPTIVTENGMRLGAHRINPAKEAAWKSVMYPPSRAATFVTNNLTSVILTLMGAVVGWLLGKFF